MAVSYKVELNPQRCSPNKPWCLLDDTEDEVEDCFATQAEANAAMRDLIKKGDEPENQASELISYLVPLQFAEAPKWIDGNKLWLQIYPFDTWDHPLYGETTIDSARASALKSHFDNKVRGHDVVVDYEHGVDPAKGKKAAGWYRQLDVRDNGLWGLVEFSDTAKQEINAGEWKYFSGEHYDTWTHPQNGNKYDFVLSGGGLTNKPWVKGMLPINFSEVMTEKQFAATPKKPYGDVTYADPGYQSDKKKRYPLDTETHIRAAWSYINMPKNAAKYSSSQVASIKSKIRAAMKRIGASVQNSEEAIEKELNANLMPEDEATRIVDEHAAEEHHDPGLGGVQDPYINYDDAADSGSRRQTPPAGEDGSIPDVSKTVENSAEADMDEAKLREILGIGTDADLVGAVNGVKERADKYDAIKTDVEQKVAFSEAYPEQAMELEMLRKDREANMARQFAEDISKLRFKDKPGEDGKTTTLGLSGLSIQTIEETAKKFTEGNATLEDFKGSLEAIINNGVVDYGTTGSSRISEEKDYSSPANYREARRMFAELVADIQKKDELEYDAALRVAAQREPELFDAYRQPPVVA